MAEVEEGGREKERREKGKKMEGEEKSDGKGEKSRCLVRLSV
jgi:hypothetical protein